VSAYLKIPLVFYLVVLFFLALMPLTGYYAALAALPVMAVFLYRRYILETEPAGVLVTRSIFLFALCVFLIGFAGNFLCTLYTTYRMSEFRGQIDIQKKRIYGDLK